MNQVMMDMDIDAEHQQDHASPDQPEISPEFLAYSGLPRVLLAVA